MFDNLEKPKGLPDSSIDAIKEALPVADEIEEIDFTSADARAKYKDEVFKQVQSVVELSSQYFKRKSAEHSLRDYDKIGLQNTALVRAFFGRFQAQCDQLELALAQDADISSLILQLNRSYDLIQAKIEVVNEALEAAQADLPEESISETTAQVSAVTPESHNQPEVLSYTEINTLIDKLTDLLLVIQRSQQADSLEAERKQVILLRVKLIDIMRRTSLYQMPNSIENDPGVRMIVLNNADKELTATLIEAQQSIKSVEQKLSEPVTQVVTESESAPVMLVESPPDPFILTPQMRVEVAPSLTDLFTRAQELTSQAVGHGDEGTVKTLWENYHRLNVEGGKTDKVRQILESIIGMTESISLTEKAFVNQLEAVFLTAEERQTATMLYQKYLRHKQEQSKPETLAQDLSDIKNFLSMEGVGIESVLKRVDALEIEVSATTWNSQLGEDVAGNFKAMILDVRKQVAVENVTVEKVKATFNVLEGYYLDQVKQHRLARIEMSTKENAIQQYERSKKEYLTALNRLSQIRSAIKSGDMPQRAIDEFLDAAIDEVERAQRAYQNELGRAEAFGKVDTTEVTAAEAGKTRRSFFARASKPPAVRVVSETSVKEVVPGVVLHDPVKSLREPGTPVYFEKATQPLNTKKIETVAPLPDKITFSLEHWQQFKAEYKPNQQAFAADYQSWIDSIQGVHSSSYTRFYDTNQHPDVYKVLKDMTITQVRDMNHSRQIELPKNIQTRDFEPWSLFITKALWIPGLREALKDGAKFSQLAEFVFMYNSINKNKRNSL